MWNMTIACELRWGVALVGNILYWHGSPFMGKHFKCKVYTGGRRSFEAVIEKRATCGLDKYFCKNDGTILFRYVIIVRGS